MQEELVAFSVAKLASEKGFSWSTPDYFESNGEAFFYLEGYKASNQDLKQPWHLENYPNCVSRPSQSLLAKWLRKIHNVIVIPQLLSLWGQEKGLWGYNIYTPVLHTDEDEAYSSYEEALEAGLLNALKLIQ